MSPTQGSELKKDAINKKKKKKIKPGWCQKWPNKVIETTDKSDMIN